MKPSVFINRRQKLKKQLLSDTKARILAPGGTTTVLVVQQEKQEAESKRRKYNVINRTQISRSA